MKTTLTADAKIDWQRLREWAADPRRKVPHLAFTAGPEREIADMVLMLEVPAVPLVIVGDGKTLLRPGVWKWRNNFEPFWKGYTEVREERTTAAETTYWFIGPVPELTP